MINLYCMYDKVAEKCGPIYEADNDQVAMRNFKVITARSQFPEDYELKKLGYYDNVKGEIVPDVDIIVVDYKKLKENLTYES